MGVGGSGGAERGESTLSCLISSSRNPIRSPSRPVPFLLSPSNSPLPTPHSTIHTPHTPILKPLPSINKLRTRRRNTKCERDEWRLQLVLAVLRLWIEAASSFSSSGMLETDAARRPASWTESVPWRVDVSVSICMGGYLYG